MTQIAHLKSVFQACGRPGEAALFTYEGLSLDWQFGSLRATWNQAKTLKDKELAVFCHANDYLLDYFHGMFCFFFATRNTPKHPEFGAFIFDDLRSQANPGAKVSEAMKDAYQTELFDEGEIAEGLTARVLSLPF